MLDNFSIEDIKKAIIICKKHYPKAKLEASGGITKETIKHYSELNLDRISVGSLTHSAQALDISMIIHQN